MRRPTKSQTIAEYAILFGVIAAAVLIMQTYARRGIQAGIKVASDQVGEQLNGIRQESGDQPVRSSLEGKTLVMESSVTTDLHKNISGQTLLGGNRETTIQQDQTLVSGALSHRGPGVSFYSKVIDYVYPGPPVCSNQVCEGPN